MADFDWQKAGAFYSRYFPSLSIKELGAMWQAWGDEKGFPATLTEEKEFFGTFWQHIGREFSLPRKSLDALIASRYTGYGSGRF